MRSSSPDLTSFSSPAELVLAVDALTQESCLKKGGDTPGSQYQHVVYSKDISDLVLILCHSLHPYNIWGGSIHIAAAV